MCYKFPKCFFQEQNIERSPWEGLRSYLPLSALPVLAQTGLCWRRLFALGPSWGGLGAVLGRLGAVLGRQGELNTFICLMYVQRLLENRCFE